MRTIGLLGGMSWESTAIYYRLANELVRERLGGLHSARLLLLSVDFARDRGAAGRAVAGTRPASCSPPRPAGSRPAGPTCWCCAPTRCTRSPTRSSRRSPSRCCTSATPLPRAVRAAGLTTVGLLGTGFTMSQDFYRDRLESHGLTVLVPSAEDQALVHRVIYDELCLGVVRDESRAAYVEVVGRLVEQGAEGVILGCTEIEMLIGPDDLDVPSFPTTRIHVEAALDAALD